MIQPLYDYPSKTTEIPILTAQEAQKIEGLCKEAEMYWTAFLVESKLWGVKPQIIDLITPEGKYLGKAIQKDSTLIDQQLPNKPKLFFGVKSYLLINPESPELEGTIVTMNKGKLIARKFGENWAEATRFFNEQADFLSDLKGDERLKNVGLLLQIYQDDIKKSENRVITPQEIFEEHLQWTKS